MVRWPDPSFIGCFDADTLSLMSQQVTIDQAFAMANQHFAQGRHGEAAQIYFQIIQANPRHFEAMNNLAAVLRHMNRLDEAIHVARQASALRPDRAEPLEN